MVKYKGKSLSPATLLLLIFIASGVFQQICSAQRCGPSTCGKIQNISFPFRLKDDPVGCGDPSYELACENNVTVLNLFNGKFHVQQIDYSGYLIRLTDAGIHDANCTSFPRYFLSGSNFSAELQDRGLNQITNLMSLLKIVFLNCSNPVSDPSYVDMDSVRPRCEGQSRGTGHVYALVDSHTVMDIKDGCFVQTATFAPYYLQTNEYNLSLTSQIGGDFNVSEADVHALLVYGFELYWFNAICDQQCGKGTQCQVVNDTTGQVECFRPSCHYAYQTSHHCGILSQGFSYTLAYVRGFLNGIYSIVTLRQLPSDLSPIEAPARDQRVSSGQTASEEYTNSRSYSGEDITTDITPESYTSEEGS
ncbi:hypothetical protein L6164_030345 [Bauhinia variegata]|uniref:Uncharacterized protein n=1 Tax=Bauhinia variegata TaxID=167791 RepID=A0ACB9LCE8_BAUVA|nr:hypothetical protein L6164_030345 [Bauhinia variegata]